MVRSPNINSTNALCCVTKCTIFCNVEVFFWSIGILQNIGIYSGFLSLLYIRSLPKDVSNLLRLKFDRNNNMKHGCLWHRCTPVWLWLRRVCHIEPNFRLPFSRLVPNLLNLTLLYWEKYITKPYVGLIVPMIPIGKRFAGDLDWHKIGLVLSSNILASV